MGPSLEVLGVPLNTSTAHQLDSLHKLVKLLTSVDVDAWHSPSAVAAGVFRVAELLDSARCLALDSLTGMARGVSGRALETLAIAAMVLSSADHKRRRRRLHGRRRRQVGRCTVAVVGVCS